MDHEGLIAGLFHHKQILCLLIIVFMMIGFSPGPRMRLPLFTVKGGRSNLVWATVLRVGCERRRRTKGVLI